MDASSYLAPRRVALDVLVSCLDKGQPLDDALGRHDGFPGLDPRDRAFVRLLLATTLRRLGEIDEMLGAMIERPLDGAATAALQVLRLGAAQLLFLGTPAHAAVDTSVRLVEQFQLGYLKGLVNAVLRRISREGVALLGDRDPARLNTPGWLWESWAESYGEETTRAIAAAHLTEAPLDITPRGDVERWAAELEADILPTGTLRRTAGGYIADLPGFAEGAWWVQDAAATLPAKLLGDIKGKSVADLCAAPGGKTAQLAASGAQVTAVDRSAPRLTRLQENLTRLQLECAIVEADAAAWNGGPFDAVLVDAPCTATGTIRRNPDLPWQREPGDLARLTALQTRILNNAAALLKPGGTLVYATCSLEPEEAERQIETLLIRDAKLRRVPIDASEVGGVNDFVSRVGDLRTLPCHLPNDEPRLSGCDGFFAARLQRLP